jgi:hypothetical protein
MPQILKDQHNIQGKETPSEKYAICKQPETKTLLLKKRNTQTDEVPIYS